MDREQPSAHDRELAELLAGLGADGPPRLAFVRRAPAGITGGSGSLLCLSASFNPLTVAHLELVREASRIVPPDEILLLLARANVDKTMEGFPLEHRLGLLVRYVETRAAYSVAVCSHGRFVDKVKAIQPHYPPGTRLAFIVGFDTLIRLFDAKYYTDSSKALSMLFSVSEFIAANRDPYPPDAIGSFLARPDVAPYAGRVRVMELPAEIAALSATQVRTRLARGAPVANLVPPEIYPLLDPHAANPNKARH